MSIVTNKIANNVLDGIIGVTGTRRNLDASTDERRCFSYTKEDIDIFNKQFSYNKGTMSDGEFRTINDTAVVYVKFPINIAMMDQNDHIPSHGVLNAEEEAINGNISLQVFVDGLKIPDHEVMFYPTKSNVDVFIPCSYIGSNGCELIVEKRRYDLYKYIHLYHTKSNLQNYILDLNGVDPNTIKERMVQIYVGKKLYNYSRVISSSGKKLSVTLTTEIANSDVEIIVDPYVMFYFAYEQYTYNEKAIYEIPESYIDSIHGPVSRFSCAFYRNGLRIGNTNIKQNGRLHFEDPNSIKSENGFVSFYLSDRNFIVDVDKILYGSDYYLYNFIGCEGVKRAINTSISGNKFIDAGANNSHKSLILNYVSGRPTSEITLPDGSIITKDDSVDIKINGRLVSEEDYSISYSTYPTKILFMNLNRYMDYGTAIVDIDVKSWFGWDEVLNNNGDLFSREKVKEILTYFSSGYDDETRVANMLDKKPYLMRDFLSQYGFPRYRYNIEYDGNNSKVYFGLQDGIAISHKNNYDIVVNEKHVPSSDVKIINKDECEYFEVSSEFFKIGDNDVEISVYGNELPEFFEFTSEDISNYDGINILEIKGKFTPSKLGNCEEDIIILEKIDNTIDNAIAYPTSENKGYRLFKEGYNVQFNTEENNLVITFDGAIPEYDFIVYNKNFTSMYKYTKPETASIADVLVPIYMSESNPVPFINRGKISVYSGTERYMEGIDYIVKNPENEKSAGCSYLILRREVEPGTVLDVYFSNAKTNVIFNKTGYFRSSRYGLFYLGFLKFPFSFDYMNLYLNGKKLSEDDVDILSDKLIRVHSLPVPMYDLNVETEFILDQSELDPFISIYEEDNFELYLARLFRAVDPSFGYSPDQDTADPNEVYESFVDTVDSVNKRPNEELEEVPELPPRHDPYKTSFLKWYTTAGNAIIQTKWDIPNDIARKFDLYRANGESEDICIRAGDQDVIVDINMNDDGEYPWTVPERKRFFANFVKSLPEGFYSLDEILELYKNSPAANMLYIEDLENLLLSGGDDLDIEDDIDIYTLE